MVNPSRELTELTGKWKNLVEHGFIRRLFDNEEHAAAIQGINTCVKASLYRFEVSSNLVILKRSLINTLALFQLAVDVIRELLAGRTLAAIKMGHAEVVGECENALGIIANNVNNS